MNSGKLQTNWIIWNLLTTNILEKLLKNRYQTLCECSCLVFIHLNPHINHTKRIFEHCCQHIRSTRSKSKRDVKKRERKYMSPTRLISQQVFSVVRKCLLLILELFLLLLFFFLLKIPISNFQFIPIRQ